MNKHTFAKGKIFECIGVKIGIYSPYSHHIKDIRSCKKTAGCHLDGAIERAWEQLVMDEKMKRYIISWDVMILSTSHDKYLENEIAIKISSEYFGLGNTGFLTNLFLDGIKQANKELRMISHLNTWT